MLRGGRLSIEPRIRRRELDLDFGKLTSQDLKALSKAVDTERKRRGKRSPDNHEPPRWAVPKAVLVNPKD